MEGRSINEVIALGDSKSVSSELDEPSRITLSSTAISLWGGLLSANNVLLDSLYRRLTRELWASIV